ncbi:MAG: hypothetical protein MAG794_00791 [Gammaproteobacteria bacterium]|nr:hypothetical protein [Gammaproteobacteria bacterium]
MPWFFIFAAGVVIVRPIWPVTLAIGLWIALAAATVAMTTGNDGLYAQFAPAIDASRILGPIALAMLVGGFAPLKPRPALWCGAAHWVLRIAAAATFVGYG